MFHQNLRDHLIDSLGRRNVVFMPRWDKIQNGTNWRGPRQKPNALVLHHTAAAATDSRLARAKGNQKGANDGVINFIQNHYEVPAANFTLDRDGTVYCHAAYPIWHAGLGSFKGRRPWNALGIPDNLGNNYMLGVEIMSKGMKKDFTDAQWAGLRDLLNACSLASSWGGVTLLRRPQHRDWAPTRKVDLRYTNTEVAACLR